MGLLKILPLLCIATLLIGCSGYKMEEIRVALESGQPEKAYTALEKNAPKDPDIPFLFELGTAAHYANRFQESSTAFDRAGDIAEERFTVSITKATLSLVTSDRLQAYPGERHERLLSHYYRALNYVYLNQLDGALVECRRATALINYFKGEDADYDLFGAALLAHLSALLFEAAGEWNDAYISYKQAATYYANAEKSGVPTPKAIGHSLVRLARTLGFQDELERYTAQYGAVAPLPENSGELVLFYESGYVPPKTEESLTFPILKTDKVTKDEKFASTLIAREGRVYEEVKLEYLLRIAIPKIDSRRPRLTGIEIAVGDLKARGVLVADIERLAIETLKSQRVGILLRTLVRGVGKYLITRQAKKQNEILGALSNLAGVVTEQADTRSWQTLPNQIFMVRMVPPAGTHTLNLSFLDRNGTPRLRTSLPEITVQPNRITFLNHRTYN